MKNKKIKCIETGVIYASITEASNKLKISRASISRVLNGDEGNAQGFQFELIPHEKTYKVCPMCKKEFVWTPSRKTAYKFSLKNGLRETKEPFCSHKCSMEFFRPFMQSPSKKVRCIETNIVYSSLRSASQKTGIKYNALASCMSGRNHTAYGLHFEYVPKETQVTENDTDFDYDTIKKAYKRYRDTIKVCPYCKKEFVWTVASQQNFHRRHKPSDEPFCSSICGVLYTKKS